MSRTVRPWVGGLTPAEQDVVRQALQAAVDGPFFPESEFGTLFGLERSEVRDVLADWPRTEDPERQFNAVNGALNHLTGYPHRCEDAWPDHLDVDPGQLEEILGRIREASGANDDIRAWLGAELRQPADHDG